MTRRPMTFAVAAAAGVALVLPVDLPAQAATPSALSVAQRLTVKGRAPKTGYDRAKFGTAWTDNNSAPWGHNGCSTREDILRRDLTQLRFKKSGRCSKVVTSGRITDPYTGKVINFVRGRGTSSKVQIDHVVPLADAWQKGAQQWSTATRVAFANDPLNLLAVDGPTNQKKGAGDAATWLPPNKGFRCRYVALQVAVKAKYRAWVTAAEKSAMIRILQGCRGIKLPSEPGGR
ncbi:HNH endonuclease family protein [Branchiibius sp. NY16-3462-2]|uniref:HNH endonuclease family protein n=1 Tax=Branchiibius sp. NY16-3462-2 TaxID=1807500 RepID=UPI00345CB0E6